MNLIWYVLEANVYLLVFYGFYLALLKKETFYTMNRAYLLLSPVLALLLPCFRLSGLHPAPVILQYVPVDAVTETAEPFPVLETGMMFYAAVAGLLFIRLAFKIVSIGKLVKQNGVRREASINLVNIDNPHSFSFLNYLFIPDGAAKEATIIRHEKVHISQLHSLDILFYEIIRILNWFNPVVFMMQRDLKAVHEFIADECTALYEDSPADYALFLINNSYSLPVNRLANPIFNKSLLKERIMKLNQQKSKGPARLKYGLLFLLAPSLVFATGRAFNKEYGFDLLPAAAPEAITKPTADLSAGNVRDELQKQMQQGNMPGQRSSADQKKSNEKLRREIAELSEKTGILRTGPASLPDSGKSQQALLMAALELDRNMRQALKNERLKREAESLQKQLESDLQDTGKRKLAPPPPKPPKPKVDAVRFPSPAPAPVSAEEFAKMSEADRLSYVKAIRKLSPEKQKGYQLSRLAPPPPEPPKPKIDHVYKGKDGKTYVLTDKNGKKVATEQLPPPTPKPAPVKSSNGMKLSPPPPRPPKPKVQQRYLPPAPKPVVERKTGRTVPEKREEVVEEPPVVRELKPAKGQDVLIDQPSERPQDVRIDPPKDGDRYVRPANKTN